ncbi:MAG: DUF2225 domain-containing protein [Lachnospiraceae bacterium]
MNLLSGLEKFGLSADQNMNIFDEEKKQKVQADNTAGQEENIPQEEDFLLNKTVRCKICEKTYQVKQVKSGRVKRLESDQDLRPRHQYIDTLKYSVWSCPYCGYTALSRSIEDLTSVQRKLIEENICSKFKGNPQEEECATYTYDQALDRYKLALFNCIAKKGRISERAYLCLNMSWLLRGKAEQLPNETPLDAKVIEEVKKEEQEYYVQAYEGFMKAVATESFPMCGMEQSTVDYLMAVMSYKMGKLETASKFLQSILTSQSVNRRTKDKALDLKNEIIASIKAGKAEH